MNNYPLVSIIIPTYNRAHLIGETLDSIMAQTYTNWECIVVDDGSTDNTEKLILKYVEKDVRFQYHMCPKDRLQGGNAARNYGFEISRGDYVNWFDSDDLMDSQKIEFNMYHFFINKNIDFCISNALTFETNLNDFKELYFDNEKKLFESFILRENSVQTGVPLFKKSFLKINKYIFNESTFRGQDLEFLSSIFFNYQKEYGFNKKSLVKIRTTKENGITINYFKGDPIKIKSYFIVLRNILIKINNVEVYNKFLKFFIRELLVIVHLRLYPIVYREFFYLYKNTFNSSYKEKRSVLTKLILVFFIQISNGKLYYRLKTKIN
jgi:glycosyltransferase involved in cell wall biosynthesis